jgi:hypothetical protein
MWRVACILCLLLPLAAGAAPLPGASGQSDTADHSRHVWPASAMSATDASVTSRLSSFPTDASTELAVRALQETKAQPASTEPGSLLHFDLSRHARLALLTAPRFRADGLGYPMIAVSFFSLKW